MKKTILFLLSIFILSSCQNKHSFTLKGTIHNGRGKHIYLNRVDVNIPVPIDSSSISRKGTFSIKVKTNGPEFYQLGFSSGNFITLLAEPGEKIELDFSGDNLYDGYTVTGSKGSEQIRMLDNQLETAKHKMDSLRTAYNEASKLPDFAVKGPLLETEFSQVIKELRKKNIEFIINNTRSMASIKALYQRIDENTYVLYDPRDLQYQKIVTDSLTHYYPHSKNVQALAADTKKELEQMYASQLENMARAQPPKALDPNLKDISGKRIALSSLKGKYVLLTFWSVDSKDCIAENLSLKEIYKKYKAKGFEIYQVNIDEDETRWRNEVRFDELPWINAREDDPKNPENAILFNVRAVPANFLFDKTGTIIGTNLHGNALQIRLNQLFN
jgi:thiol-disulfide isomerase/thioredoxin